MTEEETETDTIMTDTALLPALLTDGIMTDRITKKEITMPAPAVKITPLTIAINSKETPLMKLGV